MKNLYVEFYSLYRTKLALFLRVIIFVLLIAVSINQNLYQSSSSVSVFILSWLLIIEIFYNFKVLRFSPRSNIYQISDPKNSFTIEVLFAFSSNPKKLIRKLLTFKSADFILRKANIRKEDLKEIQLTEDEVINKSVELAKAVGGEYVTIADLLCAYLLLAEPQTRLLFDKKLREEDLLDILSWARDVYKTEELKPPIRANFTAAGIGELLTQGWTYETQKYMQELSVSDFKKPSQIIGREKEYKQIMDSLLQKKGVLLIGESGSGRSAALDKLYLDSLDSTQKEISHKRFFEVLLDTILAGAENTGDIAARFDSIIQEVVHSGNVILVVRNFENIAGASTFKVNLLDAIFPYVKKGKLQIVGLITEGNYQKYIEPFKDLLTTFQTVNFTPLDEKTSLYVLFSKTAFIEKKYKVEVTYKALKACVRYARNYMPQVQIPGNAVTLLGDSVASLSKNILEEEDVIAKAEEKSNMPISAPTEKEKQILLSMEQELHKRVVSQNEAVSAVSEALRRIRSSIKERTKPISFLFLGPTGVGKTQTAKSLANLYFGSENKMIRLDMSEYSGVDALDRLLGKGDQKGELSERVFKNPFSLLLLDEFEKASPAVLNLFLQILDDGRLTDNFGKTVSFVNTFMIATSNAGSEFIREEISRGTLIDKVFNQKLLDFLQNKGIFSPELLNRFDEVVIFKPLAQADIKQVCLILLEDLRLEMQAHDIKISFDSKIIDKIAAGGFDEQFGARSIRRYIQDNVQDKISQMLLRDQIKRGDSIVVSVDSTDNVSIFIN